MKTVAFHNLGCKVNSYEMEVMQQKFIQSGYTIVPFDMKADIYVINTCSVTNIADRKSRQMLHRAKNLNPEAVVIAAGCYAQTDTKGAAADDSVDIVIGNNNKSSIVEIIEEYIDSKAAGDDAFINKTDHAGGSVIDKPVIVTDLTGPVEYEDGGIDHSEERTRVFIKIQDGCDQFCSYCIIPMARGRIRSRDKDDILTEVKTLAKAGYKEVVITGIHLSSYGIDLIAGKDGRRLSYNGLTAEGEYTNDALIKVIDAVSDIEGIERIRLGSLEPRVITEEFLTAISSNDKVCPHFHLSLQSGCDETLKRMNRRYTTDEFEDRVNLIRKYYVNPAITTDIIVGFPGETEEEFARTLEFVEKIGFYETHIFKYSKRKGTVAADMPGQLTDAEKSRRSDMLEAIEKRHSRLFREAHTGSVCEILAEEVKTIGGTDYMTGHTKDYVMCAVEYRQGMQSGDLISGVATGLIDDRILLLASG